MNPVLPLPLIIPLILGLLAVGIWLSWKSTAEAPTKLRRILLGLRTLVLITIAILLLNPGKWKNVSDEAQKIWVCLIDDTASMTAPSTADPNITRSAEATTHANAILTRASEQGFTARTYTFSDTITEQENPENLTATGTSSDLTTASDQLLTQLSAKGETLAGVVILSDGRQTKKPRNSDLTLRAQALGVPFHALPLGGAHDTSDLELTLPRGTVTAFPNQQVQISVNLTSTKLPESKQTLTIIDAQGKTLSTEEILLPADQVTTHTLSIPAPPTSTTWQAILTSHQDEPRTNNNKANLHLRILQDKARIFLAEGAPYWDSKFLAQLLRQQEYMDVHSVHRLSDTRWFRVDSDESKPSQTSTDAFPNSEAKLKAYDLVIFGKNSEHFLTPERSTHLRNFVKDQGGAVLFARSKPYTGKLPGIEPLEPVEWATGLSGEFQMAPSADGQTAGLFGQALPAPDSSIWSNLPKLKDAHRIDIVKPFTRVLAHGTRGQNQPNGQFPLLMVRRYGQGVTGLVNADGLWKWDFYPEARELGNMYQEYWIQLIYWMLSYSEFLPGQNYSLNLSTNIAKPGTPVNIRMSYRGKSRAVNPQIEITSPTLDNALLLTPGQLPSQDNNLKWTATFTPKTPGNYEIRVITAKDESLPETNLTITPPPAEMDELSADPAFLARLTKDTGGTIITPDTLAQFLNDLIQPQSPTAQDRGVYWQPSWIKWILPLLLIALLSAEWILRRRNGLI